MIGRGGGEVGARGGGGGALEAKQGGCHYTVWAAPSDLEEIGSALMESLPSLPPAPDGRGGEQWL